MVEVETYPFFKNIGKVFVDSKGNFYIMVAYTYYLAVYEMQIFDDFGNVSYHLTFGERAEINK